MLTVVLKRGDVVVGYDELVHGNPRTVIERVREQIALERDQASIEFLSRFLLLYATYSYSSLTLHEVMELYAAYHLVIKDDVISYLLKERLASRGRYAECVRRHSESVQQANYAATMRPAPPATDSIPLFVINIPRFRDRFDRLYANLWQLGLNRVHIRGIDSHSLDELPELVQFESTKGEAAVMMAHLQIWGEIVEAGMNAAVILEDDVVVTDSFIAQWWDEYGQLDIVFVNNRVVPTYGTISRFDLASNHSFLLPVMSGCGADGYLVTNSGARKLIELFQVAVAPLDVQMMAHVEPLTTSAEYFIDAQRKRDCRVRLQSRRLYPFIVDHPPANYSTTMQRTIRGYCPGLWYSEPR